MAFTKLFVAAVAVLSFTPLSVVSAPIPRFDAAPFEFHHARSHHVAVAEHKRSLVAVRADDGSAASSTPDNVSDDNDNGEDDGDDDEDDDGTCAEASDDGDDDDCSDGAASTDDGDDDVSGDDGDNDDTSGDGGDNGDATSFADAASDNGTSGPSTTSDSPAATPTHHHGHHHHSSSTSDAAPAATPDAGSSNAPADNTASSSGSSSSGSGSSSSGSSAPSGSFTGIATFFLQGGNAGACGNVNPDSALIAAMNTAQFGNGNTCGQQVQITNTNTGETIAVTIADECPSCGEGDIDLSTGAWNSLDSNPADGVFPIKWSFL